MKYYVPFSYERYGRIGVEADNPEQAVRKAEEELVNMTVIDMDRLSDYLQESEEIDREGVILDQNSNPI